MAHMVPYPIPHPPSPCLKPRIPQSIEISMWIIPHNPQPITRSSLGDDFWFQKITWFRIYRRMRPSRGPSQNKGQEDHALIAETALESESFGEEVEELCELVESPTLHSDRHTWLRWQWYGPRAQFDNTLCSTTCDGSFLSTPVCLFSSLCGNKFGIWSFFFMFQDWTSKASAVASRSRANRHRTGLKKVVRTCICFHQVEGDCKLPIIGKLSDLVTKFEIWNIIRLLSQMCVWMLWSVAWDRFRRMSGRPELWNPMSSPAYWRQCSTTFAVNSRVTLKMNFW